MFAPGFANPLMKLLAPYSAFVCSTIPSPNHFGTCSSVGTAAEADDDEPRDRSSPVERRPLRCFMVVEPAVIQKKVTEAECESSMRKRKGTQTLVGKIVF